ncbi:MAG: fibronectin type III domain-containing protein [Anaerohalosphaera sp.]|nr:fibronectin type III domain-containing protein [Anaerohalosphaera sp.]
MARFPKTEADTMALATNMMSGLSANVAIYPAPPVSVIDLAMAMNGYGTAKNDQNAALAAAEQATIDKDLAFETLSDGMKTDIRYAENTVNYDDAKLKLIGWGGRKASAALTAPGQTRLLEAPKQGDGWLFIDWKEPIDGGTVAAYRIMRRERPAGPWEDVGTAVISEATLVEQPKAIELEYKVVAVNKAGEGESSNTVMVVL